MKEIPALELISGVATAPSATVPAALTPATGDSFTIRNMSPGMQALLIQMWARTQTINGILRIRSPRMHDNVQGIRSRVYADLVYPLLDPKAPQVMYSQDTPVAELAGCPTSGVKETASWLIYYQDVPGLAARFIDNAALMKRIKNKVTVEIAITAGTDGNYNNAAPLNSAFDLLKANTDYAVLGGHADARVTTVAFKGPDTGNLRVGFPGEVYMRDSTAKWFRELSEVLGIPLIPVINSANKQATTVDVTTTQVASQTPNVTLVMAELGP